MPLTTPGTRARADELERALAGPVPPPAGVVARELEVAARLRAAGERTAAATAPTQEFRAALRTRLMAVAAVQGVGEQQVAAAPRGRAVSWRQRAATVTAGVMATAVAATGVSVAATRSLPGDPFYGVKRTVEDARTALARGDGAQGRRHLESASARLRELRELALGRDLDDRAGRLSDADAARVRALLDDMDADTRAGARLLTAAAREDRAAEPLTALTRFADAQAHALADVLPVLPPSATGRAQASLLLVGAVRAQAASALALVGCAGACGPAGLPPSGGNPGTPRTAVPSPCGCATPSAPAPPAATPSAQPVPPGPSATAPGTAPGGAPTAPSPAAPVPASGVPLPGPVDSGPLPVPTLPLGPAPLATLVPGVPVPVPALPGLVPR